MPAIFRRGCLLTALLVLCCFNLKAQLQPLKFITYTTNEGLLHNHVKKCVEDPKGFLWLITEIGLSRFDGVNFKNFQHDDTDPGSLPHNTIHDIAIDAHGRIWLALENGLCYYDQVEACFTSILLEGTFANAPIVLSLCADKRNEAIWFITDKALFKLNTEDFTISSTSCNNPTPGMINSIYLSSDNKLWIACFRHGFITYAIERDEAELHTPDAWVLGFYEGSDHIMWINHWHSYQLTGWNMLTGEHEDWQEKDANGMDANIIMTSITKSPLVDESIILITTLEIGIRLFDTKTKQFVGGFTRDIYSKYSLPTDFSNFIYTDSHGILWVCTWEGLSKVNIQEQQFRSMEIPFLLTPMFLYYNLVSGIVEADQPGEWWLGINGCGIIKYDSSEKKLLLQHLADIHKTNPFSPSQWTDFIMKTADGVVWASNTIGMVSIKDGILTQHLPTFYLRPGRKTICIGPDQSFWITTLTALVNFDPVTKNFISYEIDTSLHGPFSPLLVSESAFCSDEHIWTGTFNGLYRFNLNTHISQRIEMDAPGEDSLGINTINSLVTDGHETVFMGTPAGLGIYNIRTGVYELKGKQDHVYPILYKSMLQDKAGNLWIYTPHALFKYNPVQDEFSKFTTADGIYNFSSDPTQLFSFRQNFYIGYRGAYTEFDPLKVDVNKTMVKPLITDVFIGGELQKLDPEMYSHSYLPVAAGNNDVTFYFTGIDYTNSERITFSYRFNNDEEWQEVGTNRSMTSTNLPPGRYTFQLRARNSSGILSDQMATFRFAIAPTLVQRWWFWPSAALAFVTMVIFLANKRVRKIREEERMKTETNKMLAQLETKLLRSQMNPHFIFNSLNSIQKYIWENKEEDAAEYLARFAKLIRAILENSRKEYITLSEELDVLKLYMELEHRRSNGKFDYHIKIADNLDLQNLLLPPLLLQPYVENAIWHGVNKKSGHGNIDITINQKNNLLEIIIDDDGVGRHRNMTSDDGVNVTKTSIGTDITQQRIHHLQTKSVGTGVEFVDKVTNGVPSGTTVILTVPVKSHSYA